MAAGRRAPGRTFETSRGILLKKKYRRAYFKIRTELKHNLFRIMDIQIHYML